MSIFTYEKYTKYGALDSDVFDDNAVSAGPANPGMPYSAYPLRVMGMDHNRLMTKPELLFNLVWSSIAQSAGSPDSQDLEGFSVTASPAWGLVHPPIPIFKKHGHVKMSVRWTAQVYIRSTGTQDNSAENGTIYLQVATGAAPFDPNADQAAANVVQVASDEDARFVDIDLDDVPLLPGPREEVRLYVLGDASATNPDTSVYGSPSSGTLNGSFDGVFPRYIHDSDATWNVTNGTNRNLATDGFQIIFTNTNGDPIVRPRLITSIIPGYTASGRILQFEPELTADEQAVVQAEQTYEITLVPNIWFTNFMAYSAARDS